MPTYFTENNTPQPGDSDNRLLHKIAGALSSGGGGGGGGGGGSSNGLTDAQLRATPVPVTIPNNVTVSVTDADGMNGPLFETLGWPSDAPAINDIQSQSIVASIKRGLQNWTSLLGRIPTLGQKTTAGSIPVALPSDQTVNVFQPFATYGSGVTNPGAQRVTISDDSVLMYSIGYSNDAPASNDTGVFSILALLKRSLQNWTTLLNGGVSVNTLAALGVPRVQATSATAANIVLTATCRRVSMLATTGTWYSLTGTATSTSHYIAAGERLDFSVPASTTISVLQETTAGSVRISELI